MKWLFKFSCVLLMLFLLSRNASAGEFSVSGIIKPWASVVMTAKASGTIGEILIKEGAWVSKGEMLVLLENRREKALIELAGAKIESASAALKERKVSLANSRKALERKDIMKDVIARKEFEDSRDLVLQREADVSLWESKIKEAEAELNLRNAELEDLIIRAPFQGMVTDILVEEGETVRALETSICDVFSMDKMYVQLAIPVKYICMMRNVKAVVVEVEKGMEGLGGSLPARVMYVNSTVDPTNRTFAAKILITRSKSKQISALRGLVKPGMTANVRFLVKDKEK